MGKRILLLVVTNVLILITISIVLTILPIGSYIQQDGTLNLATLLVFSAVIGFSGAFISLAISRWMAKMMMKVRVLDPNGTLSSRERDFVDKVHRLCREAGLQKMPEVGIYDSPEVNAFATGPTKSRSLVAVSAGLLNEMDDRAVEGVLAHEVAHIANGDMITMTLLQGIVNTFVVFLARIAAWAVARFVREEMSWIVHLIAVIVFQIAFSILGSIVVLAYSRYREFHADRGGAKLAGNDKMVHALQSLKNYTKRIDDAQTSLATLKINNKTGMMRLFSSHPDLNERIQRLQQS